MSNKTNTNQTAKSTDQSKPKKKRRLLKLFLAFIVLLIVLIGLAPSIASSGLGEGMVASAISKRIDGSVEIEDLSVGWFSGTSVTGLTLKDPAGEIVLTADVTAPDVKLLAMIRGSRALGDVTVTATEATIEQYEDGTLNLTRAIGGEKQEQEKTGEPLSIPSDLSVNLTVTAPLITYKSPGAAPAELTEFQYTTNITDPSKIAANIGTKLKRGEMTGDLAGDVNFDNAFDSGGVLTLAGSTIKAKLTGKAAGKVKTGEEKSVDGSADLSFTATYTGESNKAVTDATLTATAGGESGKVVFNGTLNELLNEAGALSDQLHGSGGLDAQNFAMSVVDNLLGTPGNLTEQIGKQLNATAKFDIPQGGERGTIAVDASAENMNAALDLALNLVRQEGALQRVKIATTQQPSSVTISAATANKFLVLPEGFKDAKIGEPVKVAVSHVNVDVPMAEGASPMVIGVVGEVERIALTAPSDQPVGGTTFSNVKLSLPDAPIDQTTKATFSGRLAQGEVGGPFNGEVNLVRADGATDISGEAHFKTVPPAVVDAIINQDGNVTKTFKPSIDEADLTFALNRETNTLEASLHLRDEQAGRIERVAVRLLNPTLVDTRDLTEGQKKSRRVVLLRQWQDVELKVTPQLWEAYGSALNPVFKAVSGSQPIRVKIAEDSFVYPLSPEEQAGVTPEEKYGLKNAEADVTVELGTLTLEKSGPLATVLGVLGHFVKEFKPAAQNEWTATFSPVKARLKDGKLVYQEPMNMVMDFGGRQLHLAFDGNVDIASNQINLNLVIGKESFKGIKEIYAAMDKTGGLTIPFGGEMSAPKFDQQAFTKNLAGVAIQAGLTKFGGDKINDALGGDAGKIIKGVEGLLGGNKDGEKADPLGDLLKGVGGALNKDKDKEKKDGAKDGASKDDAKDGAAKDGAKKDTAGEILKGVGDLLGGSKKEDAKKDGATKDGATKDGATKDGAKAEEKKSSDANKTDELLKGIGNLIGGERKKSDDAPAEDKSSKDQPKDADKQPGESGDAKSDETPSDDAKSDEKTGDAKSEDKSSDAKKDDEKKADKKKERVDEVLKGIDSIFGGGKKKESDKE